jgi:hypothetical protein
MNRLRRDALKAFAVMGALAVPGVRARAAAPVITVWKDAACGCCVLWIDHLKSQGFEVVAHDVDSLPKAREKAGMPSRYRACHIAQVDGYAVEGHVPATDIRRLLSEKPDAIGLAVPRMPIGSPGMESGSRREAYDVLLVLRDGSSKTFNHYPAR